MRLLFLEIVTSQEGTTSHVGKCDNALMGHANGSMH